MAFKKIQKAGNASLESPESLLHDLRTKKIQGPLAHQADMWRSYTEKALNVKDVALQLPTGSGKTLVGLLVAEWRRRKFNEKVVYLCPTNQLVNQVVEQANNKYGLSVTGFTGTVRNYPQTDKTDYKLANKVAVTTYSALFNTNPFFADPDIIIFDDAHAAENYVIELWSLEISKYDYGALFESISLILKNHIPSSNYTKIANDETTPNDISWVDKLPTPALVSVADELIALIDEGSNNNELRYSWSVIRDHLTSCHLYYSTNKIFIRPLIAPTNTHPPFRNAKQRIYMSATLGKGGDLERIVGRDNITKLPIPSGWDQQGIGRRFFMFPESSLNPADSQNFFLNVIDKSERSLFLTTSHQTAKSIEKLVSDNTECSIFNAKEIEVTKDKFINSKHSIAIIANRYDGIDFPDNECRVLIIGGLPTSTNLQEQFFTSRMGARILLNERILTRVIQAIGRCTRSPTDYSAVIIYGEELLSYLLSKDRRKFLHPELQGELEFGIEQSKDQSTEGLLENLNIFLQQGDDWINADENIVELRNVSHQEDLPCNDELSNAVSSEIKYQYYLWEGDYNSSIDEARNVLSVIKHGDLQGYRSLWNYLAGSSCWLESKNTPNLMNVAKEHFLKAKNAVIGLRWLVDLAKQTNTQTNDYSDSEELSGVIEKLEKNIVEYGYMHNQKYDKLQLKILEGIMGSDSDAFEDSQKILGELLGYVSGNSKADGAPDPWWVLRENLCIVFEDHNEADENSKLSVKKARQAFCHDNWIKENISLSDDVEIIKVLVTPVKKVHVGALTHLSNVYLWELDDFRSWVKESLGAIRTLRNSFPGEGDLVWRSQAIGIYIDNNMSPASIKEKVISNKASEILTEE